MAIGFKTQSSSSVPTPASGEVYTFIDTADGKLKTKNSSGTVTEVGAGGGIVSADVAVTPSGDIVATDVQAAIEELDAEKAPIGHVGAKGVAQHAVVDGTDAGFMSPSDKTKLDGIASGATANDTDANLKSRANHTGTQLAGTISNFDTAADARVSAGIATHLLASDPHGQYALESDVSSADAATLSSAEAYTDAAISSLVAASPSQLDTLKELADALGSDANFAATTATALGNRLRVDTDAQGLNSGEKLNAKTNLGIQNIDNTSDANKPVSTAQASAIGAKANKAGDTFTGPVVIEGDSNGTGLMNLTAQSSLPTTPASGVSVFSSPDEMFSVRGQSSFSFKLNDQNLTDHRQIDIPDADGQMLLDPTTTDGDIIARIGGALSRIGIGGEDYILRSVGGVPSWQEENLMQDIGDGSDGSVALTGALTAPDNLYYTLLKMDSGGVLNPDAYIIYAKTLDLTTAQAGAITRTGNNGANTGGTTGAGAAGTAFTARVLATNGAGGAGVVGSTAAGAQGAAGGAVSVGNGGSGGASGLSGAGGNAGAAAISGGAVTTNMHYGRFECQFIRGATLVGGGAGGRGGNTGGGDGTNAARGSGGGGAGGAVLVLICGEIITGPSTPSGVIVAKGGNGGANTVPQTVGNVGGAGGGGGGGGGFIYCAYVKKTGPVVANLFDASGGNGGNGGGGFGTGIGGNGGAGGTGGRIQLFNITTGVGTLVTGSAGNLGTAGSGTTGGVGGSGGACVASL